MFLADRTSGPLERLTEVCRDAAATHYPSIWRKDENFLKAGTKTGFFTLEDRRSFCQDRVLCCISSRGAMTPRSMEQHGKCCIQSVWRKDE
mmetsp:Transcript_22427/g.32306  ORF Transcript_22427/g.32306 Transcript_22427/m.32306 type:complete len:91 (-) Transcript_22427:67-339(-)